MKKIFKESIIFIILILLWLVLSKMNIWSTYIFPPPQKVLSSFVKTITNGELIRHISASLQRVIKGYTISFSIAILFGTFAGMKKNSISYYNGFLEFLRNIPPLALISLLILWFGIGELSKVIVIILASFFPMFLNIKKGISSCDEKLLEVGKIFKFSKSKIFVKIIIPYAIPDILVGMRIGLGYAWRAIIGAEMIAAASGLGYFILDSEQMSRSDKIFVGIIVIGTIGYISDTIFRLSLKKILGEGVENSWN
ncbi:MAG: ABC transporter permease [Fusobacteriaceae bacterium]|jgi:sulfonate transport system permease protein|nr:ABC transporter permease [Fusobacteriaceae bacterium]